MEPKEFEATVRYFKTLLNSGWLVQTNQSKLVESFNLFAKTCSNDQLTCLMNDLFVEVLDLQIQKETLSRAVRTLESEKNRLQHLKDSANYRLKQIKYWVDFEEK
jgi:hypothetical protein